MRVWIAVLAVAVAVVVVAAGFYYVVVYTEEDENGNGEPNGNGDVPPKTYNFTVEDYPSVDGSTSAIPLNVLAACKLLNVSHEWVTNPDGSKRLAPTTTDPSKEHICENISKIAWHGTHGSYESLIEGTSDLILVARLPSEDELALASDQGVELDARPVALDAFIFIFNENCSVDGLTTEQLRGIYTGDITNWSEVGGDEADINPYQRERNSGSQELMMDLVMKDLEIIDAPHMIVLTMMGPINVLTWDECGIGYSVYFYEQFMAPNEALKLCAVDGVVPSYDSISDRSYPFTTEVFVVVRKGLEEDSKALELRDWFLSEEGQAVVEESGYVPVGST
jgi:phosphate transport system substrate-binding protein